ncbi:MAG TPA: phage holin family protein [Gammaproteobacteria bacterium]|nr:phage holin family protein [Gammaproteobacteria bacterium]
MSTRTSDMGSRERTGPRNIEARDYESTPTLLRRLLNDVGTLFAQEVALLKAETTESIGDLKAATVSMAMGGAVAFMGAFFLLLSAVYGLSNVVDPWLAALIVGGVVTLIGVIMLVTGSKKLEPRAVAPRRTAAALRRDTEMVKGVAQHEHE